MSKTQVNITHLSHSAFLLEGPNFILVFDYFDYPSHLGSIINNTLNSDYFKDKEDVYIFVSHGHSDHYTPEIFKWQDTNPNIQYILSDDIKNINSNSNYHFMKKHETLNLNNLEIKTFGSTDLGVSYLIKIDGLCFFHSGDLNWWHWKNDSTKVQLKEESDFKNEVNKLQDIKIDIAFVPVDPRLEEYFYLAGEYFAKTIQPNMLIPMHFSDKFYITKEFQEKVTHLDTDIVTITKNNRKFIYQKGC